MAISKSQKFISLLMVLVLCFSFVVPQPEAHAGLLATGIALGTAVIIAGVAYGLVPVMSGYTSQSATDYWESQFTNWANSNGRDVLELLADITFANNVLTLGSDSAAAFNRFTSDYVLSNSIGYSQSTLVPRAYIFGLPVFKFPVNSQSFVSSPIFGGSSVTIGSHTFTCSASGNVLCFYRDGSVYKTSTAPSSYSLSNAFLFVNDTNNGSLSGYRLCAACAVYSETTGYGYWIATTFAESITSTQVNNNSSGSLSASVSSSFSSNITSPARSISVPADFVSSDGLINPAFPNIGDVVIQADSPGPDDPGDGDDDDGTLLGYVHDIAVSLGITGGLFGVVSQVSDAVSNISDYVSDIYDSVSDAITSFGETVGDIADSVSGLFDEAFEWFHDTWSDFLEWLQQLIQDIIDAINAGILDITDVISLVISNIQSIGLDIVEAIDGLAPAPVPETVSPVPDDIEGIDSDFDLNLPSIWHYVTSWLACIAPFVSVIQSVWAVLPTCVVAPVYAAIVLIIVLGLLHKVIHL